MATPKTIVAKRIARRPVSLASRCADLATALADIVAEPLEKPAPAREPPGAASFAKLL
jgi:hypothetical protein